MVHTLYGWACVLEGTRLTKAMLTFGGRPVEPQTSHTVCPRLSGLAVSTSTRIRLVCKHISRLTPGLNAHDGTSEKHAARLVGHEMQARLKLSVCFTPGPPLVEKNKLSRALGMLSWAEHRAPTNASLIDNIQQLCVLSCHSLEQGRHQSRELLVPTEQPL